MWQANCRVCPRVVRYSQSLVYCSFIKRCRSISYLPIIFFLSQLGGFAYYSHYVGPFLISLLFFDHDRQWTHRGVSFGRKIRSTARRRPLDSSVSTIQMMHFLRRPGTRFDHASAVAATWCHYSRARNKGLPRVPLYITAHYYYIVRGCGVLQEVLRQLSSWWEQS
jgi:hypothetical protein